MYESFFGLSDLPFRLTPDPKFLFMSAKHREAFAHLLYGISEGSGFVAITGEVGAGKTTLIRALLAQAGQDITVVSIVNPVLTSTELLQTVNAELGLTSHSNSRKELLEELAAFLQRNKEQGRRTVVIVDEAQNLDPVVLEQIRLLSNLETETEKLIQVVLVGQPELHGLLQRHDLRQLNQRVTERWHLDKLDRDESFEYVRHRLRVAGSQGELFESRGLDLIYRYTAGVPRLINILGHRALLVAYTRSRGRVGAAEVAEAARELGYGPQVAAAAGGGWRKWAVGTAATAAAAGVAFVLLGQVGGQQYLAERRSDGPDRARLALPVQGQDAAVQGQDAAAQSPSAPAARRSGERARNRRSAALEQPAPATFDATRSAAPADAAMAGSDAQTVATRESGAAVVDAPVSDAPAGAVQERTASEEAPTGQAAARTTPAAAQPAGGELGVSAATAAAAASATDAAAPVADAAAAVVDASAPAADPAAPAADASGVVVTPGAVTAVGPDQALAVLTRVPIFDAAVAGYSRLLQLWDTAPVSERELAGGTLNLEPIATTRGLRYLNVDLNEALLQLLDLPALVELRLPGENEVRYVLMDSVDPTRGTVHLGGEVTVTSAMLRQWWNGRAHILWKDAEGLQRDLGPGAGGPAVRKLQGILAEVGVYQVPPTGLYDELTENAVRRFQESRHIVSDGIAGPITQILLNNSLARVRRPTLTRARA